MSKELSPNTTLSHYRIITTIGAGGIGQVFYEIGEADGKNYIATELIEGKTWVVVVKPRR